MKTKQLLRTASIFLTGLLLLVTHALRAEPLTLFMVGQHSMEWLLTAHEGAQGVRSGNSCMSCHEGDEAMLANKKKANNDTSGDLKTRLATVAMDLKFSSSATDHTVTLRWKSNQTPFTLSFMFDDGSVSAFSRVGCWASCHSDMRGMDADAGLAKYLGNSRSKLSRTGGGNNTKTPAELAALLEKGEFVELWSAQVGLDGSVVTQQFRLLDQPTLLTPTTVASTANYANGYWTATFRRAHNVAGAKTFGNGLQTFGVALHQGTHGHEHWVSLPVTFGKQGEANYPVAR